MPDIEHVPASLTIGIDLASQPRDTAACVIDWSPPVAEICEASTGAWTDGALVDLLLRPGAVKAGIDAPMGWPLAFIDVLSTYRDATEWLAIDPSDMLFRSTEIRVQQETGQPPLSVAVGNLAWPAMRCGRLLSELRSRGRTVDRSGGGLVVEVYPAAALRRWGAITAPAGSSMASYKGDDAVRVGRRKEIAGALRVRLAGIVAVPDAFVDACTQSDDFLDAFVSALVARAQQLGLTDPVPRGMRWAALREGWIHVPSSDSLGRLGQAAPVVGP